jgi:hypothetical protein
MVTDEEKREIIEQAKQEFMLIMPEVIGNLMANHAAFAKMNSKFYKDYPEFSNHKDIVVKVLEQEEGADPLEDYEKRLERAVPKIREIIQVEKGLDMKRIDHNPRRDFNQNMPGGNGAL